MGQRREATNQPHERKPRMDRASLMAQRSDGSTPTPTAKPDESTYARKFRERREAGYERLPTLTPEQIRAEAMALRPSQPVEHGSFHRFVKQPSSYANGSDYVERVKTEPRKPLQPLATKSAERTPPVAQDNRTRNFQEACMAAAPTSELLDGYDGVEQKRFISLVIKAFDLRTVRKTLEWQGVTAEQFARTVSSSFDQVTLKFHDDGPAAYGFLFEQREQGLVIDPAAREAIKEFARAMFNEQWLGKGTRQGVSAGR